MSIDKDKLESISEQLGRAIQQAIENNGLSAYQVQSIQLTEKKDPSQKGIPQSCEIICKLNSNLEITCELRC